MPKIVAKRRNCKYLIGRGADFVTGLVPRQGSTLNRFLAKKRVKMPIVGQNSLKQLTADPEEQFLSLQNPYSAQNCPNYQAFFLFG
jgi:hypothetical protein